ncbi:MAG TPA: hypothetical protein VMV04_01475 [Thermodesulfobacteriota bacterium]|nr:hypothetical protein [Thermodesulfobacteriota bacterium]
MKKRINWSFTGMFLAASLLIVYTSYGEEAKITVVNPTGFPPPIERKPLAPRSASLDGKTIYLVDVLFNNGDVFLQQMQNWFTQNMPTVKTIYRQKKGIYAADDPELWKEIKANNGVMIMAIGH